MKKIVQKISDMPLKAYLFVVLSLGSVFSAFADTAPDSFITGDLKLEDNGDWIAQIAKYIVDKGKWIVLLIGLAIICLSVFTILTAMTESKRAKDGGEHGSSGMKVVVSFIFLVLGIALIGLFFLAAAKVS